MNNALLSTVRAGDPAEAPITLDEVKAQLRIDDNSSDDHLGQLIEAAVQYVDGKGILGRPMVRQTWSQSFRNSPGKVVIMMLPFESLEAVKYYDFDGVSQTDTLANYHAVGVGEFIEITPKDGFSWPSAQTRPDAITIEYVAGYGAAAAVPAPLKQALLMLIAHWYENRESTSDTVLSETPFGFDTLINPYRRNVFG